LKFNVLDNGGREMKKLLALLFVLALVNVANAGMVDLVISSLNGQPINPTKEITLMASDVINVDVIYDDLGSGLGLASLSKEIVIGSPLEMTADISALTWPTDYWEMTMSKVTKLPNGNPLIDAVSKTTGSVPPGIVLDHFLFHCEMASPEPFIVALVENPDTSAGISIDDDLNFVEDGAGIIIHQVVPEPMTLTLLGLGSLFLARRKK